MKHAPLAGFALLAMAAAITLALGIHGTRAQFYTVSDMEIHVSIASPTPTFTPTVTPTATLTPEPTATPTPKPEPDATSAPEAEPKSEDGSRAEASDAP